MNDNIKSKPNVLTHYSNGTDKMKDSQSPQNSLYVQQPVNSITMNGLIIFFPLFCITLCQGINNFKRRNSLEISVLQVLESRSRLLLCPRTNTNTSTSVFKLHETDSSSRTARNGALRLWTLKEFTSKISPSPASFLRPLIFSKSLLMLPFHHNRCPSTGLLPCNSPSSISFGFIQTKCPTRCCLLNLIYFTVSVPFSNSQSSSVCRNFHPQLLVFS